MPTARATLVSPLPPAEVLRIITDFGPDRVKAWPGVDEEHLKVHEVTASSADVTEGNTATWEREHYSWDAEAGTVMAETVESNIWAPGSRWYYKLTPEGSGTQVAVTLTRQGRNLKGHLIGALLPLVGRSVLTKSLSAALQV